MDRTWSGRAAIVVIVTSATLLLTGCSLPDAANGQRVADWIAEQDHVVSATSSVEVSTWERRIGLTVEIDPDISDDDLTELAGAAERRANDAGWSDPAIDFEVGAGLSFSNAGGAPTLAVFLGMRHDERYLEASARGDLACESFFCVTMADDDPGSLLTEVNHLLALADEAGGVQGNLTFGASDESGTSVVIAQPDAPIDDAVRVWDAIAQLVPLVSGHALSIQPVGDLPSAQILDLVVPDAAAQAVAQRVAARQTTVEVTVTVSSSASPVAP